VAQTWAAWPGPCAWRPSHCSGDWPTKASPNQALKAELRRDTAIWRFNTSSVSLAELAAGLGFNDSPAFEQAFKNWTGSPPGAYRR
jgi:AraC-like DNA-binding protein